MESVRGVGKDGWKVGRFPSRTIWCTVDGSEGESVQEVPEGGKERSV